MQISVPKAFSYRDEHEIFPFQHLLVRLNPHLKVQQVGLGRHINGGPTVFWAIVHEDGKKITKEQFDAALREAGFDFEHNLLIQKINYLESICHEV